MVPLSWYLVTAATNKMLAFNWKFLTPLSMLLLITTALIDKGFEGSSLRIPALLGANVIIALATIQVIRVVSRRSEKLLQTFEPRPVAVPPAEEASA